MMRQNVDEVEPRCLLANGVAINIFRGSKWWGSGGGSGVKERSSSEDSGGEAHQKLTTLLYK